MQNFVKLILFILLFTVPQVYSQPVPQKIDSLVNIVLREFQVPGISLAIVKDGKVILTKGYGIKKLGSSEQVDEKTLFGIASNSKAFTATALAILQEEGRFNWNDKVIDYLPWFRLSDPYITKELTIKDLLVHRSGLGLGAGDLLWWPPSDYSRREIVERIKNVPLIHSFRSTYAYDNVLYITAAELIEAVSGMSWEEFITKRIYDVIGFEYSTILEYSDLAATNIAGTHAIVEGELKTVSPFLKGNSNGACGVNSCAADMAKWMMVQLDSGRINDQERLFSANTARQLWSLVTPIPVAKAPVELAPTQSNFRGYGLGFGVRDYRGYKIVSHTGGLPGYLSMVTLIPDTRLGIAVLTNQESAEAFSSLTNSIIDMYLNAPAFNWVEAYKKIQQKGLITLTEEKSETEKSRNKDSKPSLPIKEYLGRYTDQWYGDIIITENKGRYEISFTKTPFLKGELIHWQYDTFIARWYERELRADAYVNFSIDTNGKVESARMKAVYSETDFSFDFHDLLLKKSKEDN